MDGWAEWALLVRRPRSPLGKPGRRLCWATGQAKAIAQRRARSVDQQATISAVPSAPSHACACLLSFTYKLSNVYQRDNSRVSLPPTTPNLGGTSLSPSAIFLLAKMPHQSVEYRTVLGGSPSWGMSIVWAHGPGLREVRPAMSPNPYCSQSSDPQRGHHLRHDACRRAREQQRRLKRPINCREAGLVVVKHAA